MPVTELVTERRLRAKVFDLGNGKRRLRQSLAVQHVPNDPAAWDRGDPVTLEDPDITWAPIAGGWRLRSAWFGLDLATDRIGFQYQSRRTGATLEIQLVRLGTVRMQDITLPAMRFAGNEVWWDDVVPGVDIYLQVGPARAEIFKRIRTSTAPRAFLWRLKESLPPRIPFSTATAGRDNWGFVDPARQNEVPGNMRRRLQMLQESSAEDVTTFPGFRVWTWTETWTGQTIRVDPVTRAPSLSAEVSYPVVIDFDITESIGADADDGHEQGSVWGNSYSVGVHIIYRSGADWKPGYRFQTVGVPQGATIDQAVFTYTITGNGGGSAGTGAVLYGWAIDDAPAWASSGGPNEMTRTTASVSFSPWGAGASIGAHTLDVTAVIQEIVNRAGFAGGAMSLGVQGTLGGTSGPYSYIDDLSGGAPGVATLDIDYTASGGADPEGLLIRGGKLLRGGLLIGGVLR